MTDFDDMKARIDRRIAELEKEIAQINRFINVLAGLLGFVIGAGLAAIL